MTELDTAPSTRGPSTNGRSRSKPAPRAAAAPAAVDLKTLPSVLDGLPTRVMLADRDLVITYANQATIEGLRALADWIPIAPDKIVGSSLDVFHKDPSYQRRILADASQLPRRALINVGPETLDLRVVALHDEAGEYVGAMATWDNVTEKLALEKQVARITSMMENSPTNMMFADRDFV
ncbi:PAS domain-containing protein, partial [Nocardioides sp.]|uniref:PAS domain-containing protein n=1 Tax=Nocardioides sp. TaxID=35761 RepID=UPI0027517CAF|nr:hypothetical protein [Nocardioides sp.]